MLTLLLHKLTNDGRKWSSFEGKEKPEKKILSVISVLARIRYIY